MKFSIATSLVKLGFSVSHLARVGASKNSWEQKKQAAYDPDGTAGRQDKGGRDGGFEKVSPARQKLNAMLSSGIGHAFEKSNFDLGILSKEPSNSVFPTSVEDCEEFVECAAGMAGTESCADACEGDCCVGLYACDGFTGKVCKDTTSCNGDYACFYANIGEINMGCDGDSACRLAGYEGSVGKVENSCRKGEAGYGFSCYATGFYGGEVAEIKNSCQGDVTCVFAASYYGRIGTISDSCQGERWSCWRAADSGTLGNIEDSCIGTSACDRFGYYGAAGDLVGSCKGYEGCYFAAEGGSIPSGLADGCNDRYACFNLAYYGLVGEVRAACNAEDACNGAGNDLAGPIPSGIIDCCNTANECEGDNQASLPDECETQPGTPPPATPPATPPPMTMSPTPATTPSPTMSPTTSGAASSKSGKKSKTGKSGKSSKGSKSYQSENLYGREAPASMSMSFF